MIIKQTRKLNKKRAQFPPFHPYFPLKKMKKNEREREDLTKR